MTTTATFDRVPVAEEDLERGLGTFQRNMRVGASVETQTRNKIGLHSFIEGAATPEDYGALGDGVTNDHDALQALFDAGGDIFIPNKVYATEEAPILVEVDGTHVECAGTFILAPGAYQNDNPDVDPPGILAFHAGSNIRWNGGTLDGNRDAGVTGPNGFSFSYLTSRTPTKLGCIGNVVTNVHVKNCAASPDLDYGGGTPHDGGLGNSGGKGFTVQFGSPKTIVSGITIENCDIGFSMEGRVADGGRTNQVLISNVTVEDAIIGLHMLGTYGPSLSPDLGADYFSASLSNIWFKNCAVDRMDFGVIHALQATSVKGRNIHIVNDDPGEVIAYRGIFTNCDFEGSVDVPQLRHLFYGKRSEEGSHPTITERASRHNVFDLMAKMRGAGVSGDQLTGTMLADADGANDAKDNFFKVRILVGNGQGDFTGNRSQITELFMAANFDETNHYEFFDLGDGSYTRGTGIKGSPQTDGTAVEFPAAGRGMMAFQNLAIQNDVNAGIVRLRSADGVQVVGIGNNNGQTTAWGSTDGFKVASSAWNGMHLLLGAYHIWVDANDDLRIHTSAPAGDLSGTIVGTQS